MVEFSFTELALLGWAIFASAKWLEERSDARASRTLLRIFIEDANAREQMLSKFEEFKKKAGI